MSGNCWELVKRLKREREPGYGAVFEISLPTDFPAYNTKTLEGFGGHEAELLLPLYVFNC